MTEGATRGKYRKGLRTRQALIEAAIDHFSRYGYRAAGLAEIAKEVGLTRSALLHHFASKDELLAAALDRRDEVAKQNMAAGRLEKDGQLVFSGLIDDVSVHNRGLVELFTALVGESVAEGHPAHDHFVARYATTREFIAQMLVDARDAGLIPADTDVDKAAPLLIAVLDGLQIQWLYDDSLDIAGLLDAFRASLPRKSTDATPDSGGDHGSDDGRRGAA